MQSLLYFLCIVLSSFFTVFFRVGKTAIMNQYINESFVEDYDPTTEEAFKRMLEGEVCDHLFISRCTFLIISFLFLFLQPIDFLGMGGGADNPLLSMYLAKAGLVILV